MPISYGHTGLTSLFHQPYWLMTLPLAFLPILIELLRKHRFVPAMAGWMGEENKSFIQKQRSRWLEPWLKSLGLGFMIIALGNPAWPELKFMDIPGQGHQWAVLLDCSGSMSQVEQGQVQSRLRRLTISLRNAISARTSDTFSIIRVAGYADQVGPSTANSAFLEKVLEQISPALPGEDGTSLGDGLLIAADSLKMHSNGRKNQSILLVSDGRENPPDAASKPVSEVSALLKQLKIRVDWLRVELPEDENQSPESRRRGDESRRLLESLVKESGGSLMDLSQGADWSAIAAATIGRVDREWTPPSGFTSMGWLCLGLAVLFWSILVFVGFNSGEMFKKSYWRLSSIMDLLVPALLIGGLLLPNLPVIRQSLNLNRLKNSRTLLLVDVSPSMAARDAADGSRIRSARRLARGVIERLSLESGREAGIVAFSGRAVGLAPWTNDWNSLENIIDELETERIAPTGSSWKSAFETALEFYFKEEVIDSSSAGEIVMITDGEASEPPSDEQLQLLKNKGVRLSFITLGSDREPGQIFISTKLDNQPWIDKRTNTPARSRRHDQLARELAAKSGGRFLPVGTQAFQGFEVAAGLIGKARMDFSLKDTRFSTARVIVVMALGVALCNEIVIFMLRLFLNKRSLVMAIFITVCLTSCGGKDIDANVETRLRLVWLAHEQGDTIRAEALLNQLRLDNPSEPVVSYNMALLAISRGRPEAATEILKNTIQEIQNVPMHGPNDHFLQKLMLCRTLAALGYGEIQLGRFEAAVKSLEAANENADGIAGIEKNDLLENLAFARLQLKVAEKKKADSSEIKEPEALNHVAGSQKTMPNNLVHQLGIMAEEAKNRARMARSRFEQAGDEIKNPADAFKSSRRMDW